MATRLMVKDNQPHLIVAKFPTPWAANRDVCLNLSLWQQLPQSERDLLFLRENCRITGIRWLQPGLYQGLAAAGGVGLAIELAQSNALGVLLAGGVASFAVGQIWRSNLGLPAELAADAQAVQVAQRRGYSEKEAAQALMAAIAAVPHIESRPGLTAQETIRCQNLRPLAAPFGADIPVNPR